MLFLFQVTFFLAHKRTKAVGGAFGVKAVVGYLLVSAVIPALGQVAPQERGDAHNG
jgi:hypothetical protein